MPRRDDDTALAAFAPVNVVFLRALGDDFGAAFGVNVDVANRVNLTARINVDGVADFEFVVEFGRSGKRQRGLVVNVGKGSHGELARRAVDVIAAVEINIVRGVDCRVVELDGI